MEGVFPTKNIRVNIRHRELGPTKNAPLTPLDVFEKKFSFEFNFFYEQQQPKQKIIYGLEKALEVFPEFAGRVLQNSKSGELEFALINTGVPFTEKFLNKSYKEFFKNGYPKAELKGLGIKLNSLFTRTSKKPLLTVQLNHTLGGGSILNVSFSHAVVDGAAFFHFLLVWSKLAKNDIGVEEAKKCFNRERDLFKVMTGSQKNHDLNCPPMGWKKYTKRSLISLAGKVLRYGQKLDGEVVSLSEADIQHLKAGQRISTNAILTALSWKIYLSMDLEEFASKATKKVSFELARNLFFAANPETEVFMPTDIRSLYQAKAKSEAYYFGNSVIHLVEKIPTKDALNMSLIDLAHKVFSLKEKLTNEAVETQYSWLQDQAKNKLGYNQVFATPNHFGVDLFTSNVAPLPFYIFDFGSGQLNYFSSPPMPVPRIVHMLPHPTEKKGVHLHLNDSRVRIEKFKALLKAALGKEVGSEAILSQKSIEQAS